MDHRLVGEFMGTLLLIFLGDGVNANVLLAKSAAEFRLDRHYNRVGIGCHIWAYLQRSPAAARTHTSIPQLRLHSPLSRAIIPN